MDSFELFHLDACVRPFEVHNSSVLGSRGGRENRWKSDCGLVAGDQDIHCELVEEGGDPMRIKAEFCESKCIRKLKPAEGF